MSRIGVDRLKIIKHGNKYSKNKIAICPLCGCEFEYDNNDAKIEKAFYFTLFPLQYKAYIKCPECNKKICLGTKNY
jgi:DNA-directed RNA polymerase subunit RPC12/RpoP